RAARRAGPAYGRLPGLPCRAGHRAGVRARRAAAAARCCGIALGGHHRFGIAGRQVPLCPGRGPGPGAAAVARDPRGHGGGGAVTAGDATLVSLVLHLLVAWPAAIAAVAAGVTVVIPLSLMASGVVKWGPYGGRLLVHVLWVAGFSLVVAVVYVVIVLGLGKAPSDASDREILALSMLAAAIAAGW